MFVISELVISSCNELDCLAPFYRYLQGGEENYTGKETSSSEISKLSPAIPICKWAKVLPYREVEAIFEIV